MSMLKYEHSQWQTFSVYLELTKANEQKKEKQMSNWDS